MKSPRKIVGTLLLFVLMLSLLIGCSSTPANNTASAPADSSGTASAQTPSDAVTLSLNHVGATEHPYQYGSLKFAELVNEKTNGGIKVDVFPASQIASGAKAVEFVQMGTLDIALESTMSLSNFVSEADVLNLPFLFNDTEQAFKVLDGEFGQYLGEIAEQKGFKILAWWDNGFRNISNSKRPITKPEDLKGLKIRVPESKVFLATFETLGAVPTPMAISEVFSAMQLGTVDGQENPGAVYINNKYNEVNKYYSVTHHIFTAEPLIMSTDKFNSLTEDQQKAILEAAQEAGVYEREVSAEAEQKDLETIRAAGVEVNIVEDMTPFREAVGPVYDQFKGDFGTLLEKIEAAK